MGSSTARLSTALAGVILSWLIAGPPARAIPLALATDESSVRSLPDLVAGAKPSIGTIICYDSSGKRLGQGTAFSVGRGRFLTNEHVIRGAIAADIALESGARLPVTKVLAEDPVHDLALLWCPLPAAEVPSLTLRVELPREGERVAVIGSPLGLEATVSEGIISAVRTFEDCGQLIQITAPISPGSSGSPVMDFEGRVVAIVVLTFVRGQAINFSIPAKYAASMTAGGVRALHQSHAPRALPVVVATPTPPPGTVLPEKTRPPTPTWYSDAAEVLRRANAAWDKEDWVLAASLYNRLLVLFPDHPIATERGAAAKAMADESKRKAEEARRKAAEEENERRTRAAALARERANIPLYRETVTTYVKSGELDKAVDWLGRIEAIEPEGVIARSTRATVVKAIVDHFLSSMGWERLRTVGTIRFTGAASIGEARIPIKWLWARPNLFRFELMIDNKAAIQAYDGTLGWTFNQLSGDANARRMSDEELANLHGMGDIEGPLVDFEKKENAVTFGGVEDVEGGRTFRIEVTTKEGYTSTLWLSVAEGLAIKEREGRTIDGVKTDVEMTIGDYREVGGIRIPFRFVTKPTATTPGTDLLLDEVELNPVLEERLFKSP